MIDPASRPPHARRPDEETEMLPSLRLVARAVTQRFADVLDRVDVPLTLVQLRALYALLDEPDGVPLRRWAQKLEMSDPSASRLGQRLERDGLVDRQAGAGRTLSVVITDRGREALSEIEREQSRELYLMTEPLTAGDRSTLLSLVEQLTDQARADHQERR